MNEDERKEAIKSLSDYDMLHLLFVKFSVVLEDFGEEIYAGKDPDETAKLDECLDECRRRLYDEPIAKLYAAREGK